MATGTVGDYYDLIPDRQDVGLCRRNAPLPELADKAFNWGTVAGDVDYCGDFHPKGTYEKMLKLSQFMEAEAAKDVAELGFLNESEV